MNETDDNDTLQPSLIETAGHEDGEYELRYMSGALPADAEDVTSSQSIPNVRFSDPDPDPDPTSAFDPQSPSLPTLLPGTPLEAASKPFVEGFESTNRPSKDNASSRNLSLNAPLVPPSTAIPTSIEATTYRDRISRLSRYFPQLSYVGSQSRHDNANITIVDYSSQVLCGSRPMAMDSTVEKLEELRNIVCGNSLWPNVDTRLVIIEDLNTRLIDFLGATFDLSPEFFEEHLHRSGYSSSKTNEPSPETWSTSNLQKSYVSMKWYRPVNRWRQEPNTLLEREQLLDSALPGTYRIETGVLGEVTYNLRTTTNIFRPEFAMSTNPDGVIPENWEAAWEERATACSVKLDQVRFVILLLDPVPLLEKTIRGDRRVLHLPVVDDKSRPFELSNCKYRTGPSEVPKRKHSRTRSPDRKSDVAQQIEIRSPFTQTYTRTPWTLEYNTMFSRSTVERLDFRPSPFESTKEAFEKWLFSVTPDYLAEYSSRLGPASMIVRFVHQDTVDLLRQMRVALAKIARVSSDNVLQERALHWRYRLDQFRAQLLELEESMQRFIDFVHPPPKDEFKQRGTRVVSSPIQYFLSDALDQISSLNLRLDQAYSSLTSKVQISDSHRSIAEAETVTRLTELAFLFIPLSFATSIFGMQIVDGSTPVSTYIAVALALTSAAYVLRFFIHRTTSQRIAFAQRVRKSITAYANLITGSRIPTALFFQWLLHRFQKTLACGATVLIMVVIPLPILWTRDLNSGIQTAISALLISVPVFQVLYYVLFSDAVYPAVFGTEEKEIRKRKRGAMGNGTEGRWEPEEAQIGG